MNRTMKRNLDDLAQLAVAAWLVMSPFILGYNTNRAATLTMVAIGAFLPFTTQFSLANPGRWEEVINLVLGVFLIASPFLIGYSGVDMALYNAIASGVVLGGLAVVGLIQQSRLDMPEAGPDLANQQKPRLI